MIKMSSSREVSTMIKQGFISDPTLTISPSRNVNSTTISSPKGLNFPTSPKPYLHPPTPPPQLNQTRPTLFQMMSEEQSLEQTRVRSQARVSKIMGEFESLISTNSGLLGAGDVRVTVVGKDGCTKVSIDVHKSVLLEKSGFFRETLSGREKGVMHSVEISECDDVEVYLETLVLMYCDDLTKRLTGEEVSRVLALLKVCAAIMFDVGIMSCLEYLEAVPWSEDEETKVISHIDELQLHDAATEVLQRVSSELCASSRSDDIFLKLLSSVLLAKDDKARKEMKILISRLFKEDSSNFDNRLLVSKDSLYNLCHRCLSSLVLCLSEATCIDDNGHDRGLLMSEIGREAENLQWVVDILIDRKLADEFVKLWADQKELAVLHSKIPTMYRHEISKITAQLCIAIGRGQILVPRDTRYSLLTTWLEALYNDFGWMRAACSRTVDKKLVEDGLCQTILTLPLLQQQSILLNWFDRFINKGDDCPNIQRAFEIWWRRTFVRRYAAPQDNSKMQITVCHYPN